MTHPNFLTTVEEIKPEARNQIEEMALRVLLKRCTLRIIVWPVAFEQCPPLEKRSRR